MSKGSANHSQSLQLDRDANRALTDLVPPSLRRALIHQPPNKTSGCSDQTRHSEAAALVNASLSTYAHKYMRMQVVFTGTHLHKSMHHGHPSEPNKTNYAPYTHSHTCRINHHCLWQNIMKYEPHIHIHRSSSLIIACQNIMLSMHDYNNIVNHLGW